jgi:DNA-binding CsgD family transcriptional regulator
MIVNDFRRGNVSNINLNSPASGKQFLITVFDSNPIHCFAFRLLFGNGRDISLTFLEKFNAEAEGEGPGPDMIMVNLVDPESCCLPRAVPELLDAYPASSVICYSSALESVCMNTDAYGDRVVYLSYENLIASLKALTKNPYNVKLSAACISSKTKELEAVQDLLSRLSPRELEVFRLSGKGNGPADISDILGCSMSTVETHLRTIRNKCGFKTSVELRKHAVRVLLSGHCHFLCHELKTDLI